jgi:hypothetical protein
MMARHRNWHPLVWAEVLIRIVELEQNPYRVAKATGLNYIQVKHFADGCNGRHVPTNLVLPTPEQIEEVRARVEAASAAEDAAVAVKSQPVDALALAEEITGCIELVKQAASQFRMTPRHFLWLCSTDARSAV